MLRTFCDFAKVARIGQGRSRGSQECKRVVAVNATRKRRFLVCLLLTRRWNKKGYTSLDRERVIRLCETGLKTSTKPIRRGIKAQDNVVVERGKLYGEQRWKGRQETPWIVANDSVTSELQQKLQISNNFKPLLKEKRLKEQTSRQERIRRSVRDSSGTNAAGIERPQSEGLQDYKFLIQVLIMKIKRLRREETPRIVGDDSARSEPTEVADSNDFKPLLKEKRLKEQTKRIRGTKKERNTEMGVKVVWGRNLHFEVKKGATTQRRSLGRRPRTTWPGWKDTVNKKGSRDDCGYESKSTHRKERKTFVGNGGTEFGTEFVQGGRLDFGAQSRRKREVKNARNVACERG
ncbi:hypothetical protein Tco_0153653 [Tanacetum coccineum]